MTRFKPGFLKYLSFVGVNFDGATYLTRGGDLTGAANGTAASGSFWIRMSGNGTTEPILHNASPNIFEIRRGQPSDKLFIQARSIATGLVSVNLASAANSLNAAAGWVHVLWSFNSATAESNLYFNDANALDAVSNSPATLDLSHADWYLGWDGAASYGDFDLAEFWMVLGTCIDFSAETNRRKFITASGYPAWLGTDGSLPGVSPIIYQSGAVANWHTNKGTGGGFTENGTLTETDFP